MFSFSNTKVALYKFLKLAFKMETSYESAIAFINMAMFLSHTSAFLPCTGKVTSTKSYVSWA